ncbi:hypothetical protein, partial [Pseudomonas sp. GZD-209]|uniref:hypothetical protein n=1 Tax=Pseudomonas sp. GZD-209 TaxID=3404807 RepID=UPI003BB508D7
WTIARLEAKAKTDQEQIKSRSRADQEQIKSSDTAIYVWLLLIYCLIWPYRRQAGSHRYSASLKVSH